MNYCRVNNLWWLAIWMPLGCTEAQFVTGSPGGWAPAGLHGHRGWGSPSGWRHPIQAPVIVEKLQRELVEGLAILIRRWNAQGLGVGQQEVGEGLNPLPAPFKILSVPVE